jgi:hypothetical protein
VLEDLWLEPEAIGAGHGRRLWEHAVGVRRRPPPRSARPSKPSVQNRLRHVPTVLGALPSLRAIAALASPAAASSTILALVTCRCWAVAGAPAA